LLGTNLLAANFNSGKVDVYDSNYTLTSLGGTFTDPNLPAGFAPHGIHVLGNQIYVAYAMQDTPKHDAFPGVGAGQVDIFDTTGNFVSTFVAAGATNKLNAPWGVVQAPASFGTFAGDILVSNFGDGTISAFDTTGKFQGQLSDSSGKVLVNPGMWDMVFGGGGGANNTPGVAGTLYITAGASAGQPNFPAGGSATAVFASLAPATAAGSGFSLNLSSSSTTVSQGGSATLMVSAAAVGGFNSQITLTCSAPSGLTSKPFNHLSWFEHRVLDVDHLRCLDPAAYRLRPAQHGSPHAWFGTVRNAYHDPQAEIVCAEEHRGDELAWFGVVRLAVLLRMRRYVAHLKQSVNVSVPDHCNGDRDLRRSESFQCGDGHHQLKQNHLCEGARRCALAMGDLLTKVGSVDCQRSARKWQGETRVVERTSYGLTGLTTMSVIAFCFVYGRELPPTREKSSNDRIDNPHRNDSPKIATGARSLRREAFHG